MLIQPLKMSFLILMNQAMMRLIYNNIMNEVDGY